MTGNDIIDNLVLIIMHARSMKPTSFLTKKEINAFIKFHYPSIYNITNYDEFLKKAIKKSKNILFESKRRSKAVRKEILKMKKQNFFSNAGVQNECHLNINIKEQNDVEERKIRIRKKIKMYREMKNQENKPLAPPMNSFINDPLSQSKQYEDRSIDIDSVLKTEDEIIKDYTPKYDGTCITKNFDMPIDCVSDLQNINFETKNLPKNDCFSDSLNEIIYSDDVKYISPRLLTSDSNQVSTKYNFPVFYLNEAHTRTGITSEQIPQPIQFGKIANENCILSDTQLSFDQNDPFSSSLQNTHQENIILYNLSRTQQENIFFDNLLNNHDEDPIHNAQQRNFIHNNFQTDQHENIIQNNLQNAHQEVPSNINSQNPQPVDTQFNNMQNNNQEYHDHSNIPNNPQNNPSSSNVHKDQIQDPLPPNFDYNITFNHQNRPVLPKYINFSYGELKERFKRENKFF